MGVSKENVGIKNIPFLMHDFLAEGSNTSACINDDAARTTSNLKAGRVSAIFNGIRARTSYATSGSPELETKGSFNRHVFSGLAKCRVFFACWQKVSSLGFFS